MRWDTARVSALTSTPEFLFQRHERNRRNRECGWPCCLSGQAHGRSEARNAPGICAGSTRSSYNAVVALLRETAWKDLKPPASSVLFRQIGIWLERATAEQSTLPGKHCEGGPSPSSCRFLVFEMDVWPARMVPGILWTFWKVSQREAMPVVPLARLR
ncbi:hypothetical protein EV356DRAFT_25914 [Viridothelium virens]|uniref:Uncharacterized protein n=1 Tax=Viridothelium virens TaxID=1048519 RepID=A0A6A6HG79_VIRVR|nr:hypothetical protein EV356DRAFT_25914 [Viridothelium virens]